jgi:hypothetical protein
MTIQSFLTRKEEKRSFWVNQTRCCVPGELGTLCDAALFLSAPSTFQVDPFVPPDAPAVVVCSFLERTVHLSGAVFCFSMVMLMLCAWGIAYMAPFSCTVLRASLNTLSTLNTFLESKREEQRRAERSRQEQTGAERSREAPRGTERTGSSAAICALVLRE